MNQTHAIQTLSKFDTKGRYIFTNSDLSKVFHDDNKRALRAGIQRLVESNLLVRACNGVFVNNLSQSKDSNLLEQLAKTIRRGEYNYVSLESALSEYGVISQIPVDRLSVMTTGRKGEYKTPYGTIEFTHTKRAVNDILKNTHTVGRPLRLATKDAAFRDLKRVGRNVHLVDKELLHED
jgi:predicted transcriptional regulator of viral defense system